MHNVLKELRDTLTARVQPQYDQVLAAGAGLADALVPLLAVPAEYVQLLAVMLMVIYLTAELAKTPFLHFFLVVRGSVPAACGGDGAPPNIPEHDRESSR